DQADQWGAQGGATIQYIADRTYQGLTFDASVEPFDDIHVRRAVAHGIDRQAIVDGVLRGHGAPATGIDSPEALAGWVSLDQAKAAVAGLPVTPYDLDQAKSELAQSQVPDGFTTILTYPTGYAAVGKASLAIADSLSQVGITVEVKEITLEQWLNEVGDGEHGIGWMIYEPTTPLPDEITSWLLAADGPGANPANWTDPSVSALLASIATADDDASRLDLTIQATAAALEQVIYAPVYWGEAAIALRPGVSAPSFGTFTLMSNWSTAFTVS
ncbi:MAG: ABC transporter substrate-binding protein, partial [Bifidobacteriaceae bacterium]|nr:ABC transporter substrate-binding protein [Bifidobacteriaceae bacterium]